MKVFLQVKRLGNVFTRMCLNVKHTNDKYDHIRKHHGMGAVLRAQHPTA